MKERIRIGVGSIIIIIMMMMMTGCVRGVSEEYDSANEWLWEMEVKASGVFAELVDEAQRYIDSVAPNSGLRALPLVYECTERGVSIALVLAQGHLESHFGTRGLAKRTHSVWNIGAFDGADSITALNRYSNPNISTREYVRKIDEEYLNGRSVEDLLENFVNTRGQRYATDPHYEERLRIMYNDILDKMRIDELQNRYTYYTLRLK